MKTLQEIMSIGHLPTVYVSLVILLLSVGLMHDIACKVGSDCSIGILLNSLIHVDLNGYINPPRHKLS